jgi:hypothetical protein
MKSTGKRERQDKENLVKHSSLDLTQKKVLPNILKSRRQSEESVASPRSPKINVEILVPESPSNQITHKLSSLRLMEKSPIIPMTRTKSRSDAMKPTIEIPTDTLDIKTIIRKSPPSPFDDGYLLVPSMNTIELSPRSPITPRPFESNGLKLPKSENVTNASDCNNISSDTMIRLMNGEYNSKYIVIDCRYPFEYEKGHIKDAINCWLPKDLEDMFFKTPMKECILVFHCEFSQKRGPNLYRELRDMDRKLNRLNYPNLFYPDIYLLQGGYKSFYEGSGMYCEPRGYCSMFDSKYEIQLNESIKIYKKSNSVGTTRNFKLSPRNNNSRPRSLSLFG